MSDRLTDRLNEILPKITSDDFLAGNVAGSADVPREAFHDLYDALVAAADFFALRKQCPQALQYDDAEAMYHAYETELFRFDQLYRHFCEYADAGKAEDVRYYGQWMRDEGFKRIGHLYPV